MLPGKCNSHPHEHTGYAPRSPLPHLPSATHQQWASMHPAIALPQLSVSSQHAHFSNSSTLSMVPKSAFAACYAASATQRRSSSFFKSFSHDTSCNTQHRAREWVSANLECNSSRRISLFETNIRIVGGLLGAYELSQDAMFLNKAQECVDLMLPVFATSPTGKGHVAVSSLHSALADGQFNGFLLHKPYLMGVVRCQGFRRTPTC